MVSQFKTLAIAGLFAVSASSARAEVASVKIMGISLWEALNLPPCGIPLPRSCKRGPNDRGYWEIEPSKSIKPAYVRSFRVRVIDGSVEEMQIATTRGRSQAEVIEDLSLKFGKPNKAVMLSNGLRESWNLVGGGAIIHDTETGQVSVITPKSWAWNPPKQAPARPHL